MATLLLLALIGTMVACGPATNSTNNVPSPSVEPTAQQVAVAPQAISPRIKLDPPSGEVGTYVQIAGSGWPANLSVVLMLTDPSGISTSIATAETDPEGNLSTGFLYPVDRRWSVQQSYIVNAQSADGQYQAGANYVVIDPAATATAEAATPTPVPTLIPTVLPTETPTVAPTIEATAIPPTSEPTPIPQVSEQPTSPPALQAALVSLDERRGDRGWQRGTYRVEFANSENFAQLTTLLMLPPLEANADIRLETDDDTEIEINDKRVKISAPNPQWVLESIQQRGGIEIPRGIRIEYRQRDDHKIEIEFDDDGDDDEKLKLEGATLHLLVIATDHAGQTHQIALTPAMAEPNPEQQGDDHRGRGGRNRDDDNHRGPRHQDDRGDWDDDDD